MTKENNIDKKLNDQLDDHFSDPYRKKLMEALDATLERNHSLKKNKSFRWEKMYFPLVASVFLIAAILIFALTRKGNKENVLIETVQGDSISTSAQLAPEALTEKSPLELKESGEEVFDQKNQQENRITPEPDVAESYAGVDLSRFKPNAELDVLTQSFVRGERVAIKMEKNLLPVYYLSKNTKNIKLYLMATLESDFDSTSDGFQLILFNNISNIVPVVEIPLEISLSQPGSFHLMLRKELPLDPGLYYYIIESAKGDIIEGGQFKVTPKN